MAARVDLSPSSPDGQLSREEIAERLMRRRDRLIRQVPGQIKIAKRLTQDQCALVVDLATDFLVTENEDGVIADQDALERAFWKAAHLRVWHVLDGRHETVRGRFRRVDVEDIGELPAADVTPEDTAIRSFELETLEEFRAELSDEEQAVLKLKYIEAGKDPLGRFTVAKLLGKHPSEVRRHERSIRRKLLWFSAIVAAGSLCDERRAAIRAMAKGSATRAEYRRARAHLRTCLGCRTEYNELRHAIKSGQLPREISQILPMPALDAVEPHRGPWEIAVDLLSRPFGHDASIGAAQLAPIGRGVSAIAGAKLVSLCLGGAAAVGGAFCIHRFVAEPPPPKPPRAVAREKPKAVERDDRPRRSTVATPTPTAVATKTPAPKRKRTSRQQRAGGQVSSDPTSHEKAVAISPPATAPDGSSVSEFEPGPATSAPSKPAAAPDNGGHEFF